VWSCGEWRVGGECTKTPAGRGGMGIREQGGGEPTRQTHASYTSDAK